MSNQLHSVSIQQHTMKRWMCLVDNTMTVLLKNLFTVHFQFDLLKLETNNTRDDELKHAWITVRWTVGLWDLSLTTVATNWVEYHSIWPPSMQFERAPHPPSPPQPPKAPKYPPQSMHSCPPRGVQGGRAAPPATTMFGRAVGTRPNIVSPNSAK